MTHSTAVSPSEAETETDVHLIWQNAPTEAKSARHFSELHNVHAWALPFAKHRVDGFELMKRCGHFLAGRPAYCQRVTKTILNDNIETEAHYWESADVANNVMLAHGWWKGGSTSRGRYYCNPSYTHRHPESDIFTDREVRKEFLVRAAALGVLAPSDVAPVFGFTGERQSVCNSVCKVAHRLDFPWAERRREGMRRMSRTWATLHSWGYPKARIARHFGVSKTRVVERTNEVLDAGFTPPTDPTAKGSVDLEPEPLMDVEATSY